MNGGLAPWRARAVAAALLGAALLASLPAAQALDCPSPVPTTSATQIPEDGVLIIYMSSPTAT